MVITSSPQSTIPGTHDRNMAIESYEVIQVISALLVGIGAALWPEVHSLTERQHQHRHHSLTVSSDSLFDEVIIELTQVLLIGVIACNLSALLFLSVQIFYLHQCLAKDANVQFYDDFSLMTKSARQLAMGAVFYSMPVLMMTVGLVLYQQTATAPFARASSFLVIGGSFWAMYFLHSTRRKFKVMRQKYQMQFMEKNERHDDSELNRTTTTTITTATAPKTEKLQQRETKIDDGQKIKNH